MTKELFYLLCQPFWFDMGEHVGGGFVPVDGLTLPLLFCRFRGDDFVGFAGEDEFGAGELFFFRCFVPGFKPGEAF